MGGSIHRSVSSPGESLVTRFYIQDGKIPVVLHEPESVLKGTVLLLHGLLGHKDSEKFVTIAGYLADRGWRAVRFDQAGSGESNSPLRSSLLYSRFRDLTQIVRWLRQEILHDREELYLWGSSLGGYIAYLYACMPCSDEVASFFRSKEIPSEGIVPVRALISWAAPFDISLLEDFLRATPPFCNCLDLNDPVGVPKRLEKIRTETLVPCLIVHGIKDEIVPWHDALKIRDITRGDLFLFDHADHRFSETDDRMLAIKASTLWLERKSGNQMQG